MAEAIGIPRGTYQTYEAGRSVPPDIQEKIRELGYEGEFPEPEAGVTRAELDAAEKRIVAAVHWGVEEIKRAIAEMNK